MYHLEREAVEQLQVLWFAVKGRGARWGGLNEIWITITVNEPHTVHDEPKELIFTGCLLDDKRSPLITISFHCGSYNANI